MNCVGTLESGFNVSKEFNITSTVPLNSSDPGMTSLDLPADQLIKQIGGICKVEYEFFTVTDGVATKTVDPAVITIVDNQVKVQTKTPGRYVYRI